MNLFLRRDESRLYRGGFRCGKMKTGFQCIYPTWEQIKNTRHIFQNMSDLFKISQTYFCEGRNGVSGIKTNSDPRPAGALCKGKHYRQHTPAGLPPIYNNVYSPGRAGGRQQIKMHCLKTVHFMILLFFCLDYSPGAIAPLGHTSAQVPQSTQASGLIEYFSPSEIAPLGHSSIQVPHATQSSLIT